MKVVVVYKSDSEHGRIVEDFLHDFRRQTGKTLETLEPETREGTSFCETYDIVQYPTLVALDDSSQMIQMWVGDPLPRISEVSYYAE